MKPAIPAKRNVIIVDRVAGTMDRIFSCGIKDQRVSMKHGERAAQSTLEEQAEKHAKVCTVCHQRETVVTRARRSS